MGVALIPPPVLLSAAILRETAIRSLGGAMWTSPAVRAVCAALPAELTALVRGFHDVTRAWTLVDAAASGLLPLVEERSAEVPAGDERAVEAMDVAAELGHLEVIQWLHAHRREGCTTDAMDLAACNGHLHVVAWLHEHRREGCTTDAMDLAAASGHLSMLRFLHRRRCEGCSELAMDLAAAQGHLRVIKWLHAHRGEGCSSRALLDASAGGHAHVARWLLQFRPEGSAAEAARAAAAGGHAALARWLLEHAFLRDERGRELADERWRWAAMHVEA